MRKFSPQQPSILKKTIVLGIGFLLVGYSMYRNNIFLEKDHAIVKAYNDFLTGEPLTYQQIYNDFSAALSHPEIGNEEGLHFNIYPAMRMLLSVSKPPDSPQIRSLLDLLKNSIDINNPLYAFALNEPAKTYNLVWLLYGKEQDYQQSIYYYKKILEFKPNSQQGLLNLYCLYLSHKDSDNADVLAGVIKKNWNMSVNLQFCLDTSWVPIQ